jgi:diguanylate cyclase
MSERRHVLPALQALLDRQVPGDVCALLVLRLQGMREAQLRMGYDFASAAMLNARDRIVAALRHIDQVYVAGEDSFAIWLPAVRNRTHSLLAATRLAAEFDLPLHHGDRTWHARVAMGIALAPEQASTAEELFRKAELAHDAALRRGEAFAVHEPGATPVDILYGELREDIGANRLHVAFQPLCNARNGRMVRVESLARWTSEAYGEVPPGEFVPFAERSDLIVPLTQWSLNATLRHAATMQRLGIDLDVAINVSPRVFAEQGFAEHLLGALDIWAVPPERIVVEVTETALMVDMDTTVRVLRRLRDRGIRVGIDDFGTGYASFAYLRHFPATELKIDRSFVEAMLADRRTEQLVGGMVDVAARLGLESVAEGVENEETLQRLIDMGCDLVQGYHVGRPIRAEDFIARVS